MNDSVSEHQNQEFRNRFIQLRLKQSFAASEDKLKVLPSFGLNGI